VLRSTARLLTSLGLLLFLAAAVSAQRARTASTGSTELRHAPRPNLLVIVGDDIGWRDIDASIPTPSLDRLADEGVTYRRAYSTPLCSPTRLALLFGLHGFREELGQFINTCDPGDVSVPLARMALPQVLRKLGYRTFAAGKWHLNTVALGPLNQAPQLFGFDTYRAGWVDNLGKVGTYFDWPRIDDGVVTSTTEYNTTAIRRATTEWWAATDGPKFAYVAFHAPHGPFHAAPASLLPPGYVVGPTTRDRFESMIVALDTELGHLLAEIDLRDTLVLFISDNGTPEAAVAPDQDAARVKSSVYEGGIHVPVFAAGWGVARGQESQALIGTTDLFATVLDVLGVSVPAGAAQDSVSFAPTLTQPASAGNRTWVYSQAFAPNGSGPYGFNTKAIVTATHKLWYRNGQEVLYDLVNDPTEASPIAPASMPGLYSTLRAPMTAYEAAGAP